MITAMTIERGLPHLFLLTCSCPHRFTILGSTIVALGLAVTAIVHCTLVAIGTHKRTAYGDYVGVGLFGVQDPVTRSCVSYEDLGHSLFTVYFKCARAFGIIAAAAAGLSMLMCAFMLFVACSKHLWIIFRLLLGLALLSQALTFLVYADPAIIDLFKNGFLVVPGVAGICSFANVIILLVTTTLACVAAPPSPVCGRPSDVDESADKCDDEEQPEQAPVGDGDNVELFQETGLGGWRKQERSMTTDIPQSSWKE